VTKTRSTALSTGTTTGTLNFEATKTHDVRSTNQHLIAVAFEWNISEAAGHGHVPEIRYQMVHPPYSLFLGIVCIAFSCLRVQNGLSLRGPLYSWLKLMRAVLIRRLFNFVVGQIRLPRCLPTSMSSQAGPSNHRAPHRVRFHTTNEDFDLVSLAARLTIEDIGELERRQERRDNAPMSDAELALELTASEARASAMFRTDRALAQSLQDAEERVVPPAIVGTNPRPGNNGGYGVLPHLLEIIFDLTST
jgi:hypothetical protein